LIFDGAVFSGDRSDMSTVLVVCETCGFDDKQPDAVRPGELLARALEQRLENADDNAVAPQLHRFRCLMSCKRHCVVQVRAPYKIGYVIGDFVPDAGAVETLLDYSRKYMQSESGQVPFKEWPEGVKGKFIARIPPLEF
jgi:predicted metal-binding protein